MIVIEVGRPRHGNCSLPVGPGTGGAADRKLPCRAGDPDLWFAESPADLERAKGLCGGCAVRSRCLSDALDRAEPWGVWGGEIFRQGVVVARKRSRGRPRRNTVVGCSRVGRSGVSHCGGDSGSSGIVSASPSRTDRR
ncbi:WhiB family transcriptional regulator [Rhodococcus sp. W8901]|uniref:WhiB family transcriptional regulator n=1 Tax=unclassified Rhodococcus (in: high G+C Gram-positive bacteria) TaxID=192944 RepID=UPI0015843AF7|nr:WhiB family transcriptional regulator [Rhodococcus sp. W8901]